MLQSMYYERQTVTLSLLVVAGVGASLLGCNWLEKATLNWKAVYNVNRDQLQAVLNQFSAVFKLGVKVKITKLTVLLIQPYHQKFAKHIKNNFRNSLTVSS